jgi:hypothetical protein
VPKEIPVRGWIARIQARQCRRLAFTVWTILIAAYILSQFLFLGWVGPVPIFLLWSFVVLPIFAITLWWLHTAQQPVTRREIVLTGAAWLILGLVAVSDVNPNSDGSFWILVLAFLVFPVLLSYQILKHIEGVAPSNGTA